MVCILWYTMVCIEAMFKVAVRNWDKGLYVRSVLLQGCL